MGIVAGLDSSPDFTRIVVCDTDSGAVLRQGYAQHPVEGPEGGGRPSDVDPQAWLLSLGEAAGGGLLEGVQAIGVSAQQNAVVPLVVCPRFFTPGADELRELTILHEMVHVVAGTNECQAMAFAARVQHAATGRFTPVDGYWRASGCESSQYRLP